MIKKSLMRSLAFVTAFLLALSILPIENILALPKTEDYENTMESMSVNATDLYKTTEESTEAHESPDSKEGKEASAVTEDTAETSALEESEESIAETLSSGESGESIQETEGSGKDIDEATKEIVFTDEEVSETVSYEEFFGENDVREEFAENEPVLFAEAVPEIDARDDLVLNGVAKRVGDEIHLTEAEYYVRGGAFFPHEINTKKGFKINLKYKMKGGSAAPLGGADGIVLTFSDKIGLGGGGEHLGFVGGNSYGVELDTFHNYFDPGGVNKHVAVIYGNTRNHLAYVEKNDLDDNGFEEPSDWHDLELVYVPGIRKITVSIDGDEVLSYEIKEGDAPMPATVFLGVSASTGEGYNKHYIKDFRFEGYISNGQTFDTDPIVFVHGIMGSRLFSSSTDFRKKKVVWTPTIMNVLLVGPDVDGKKELYVRPCENQNIDIHVPNDNSTVDDFGREYGAADTYKPLIDALCDMDDRPVYFYSYDWRNSNADSAEKLKLAIDKILEETNSEKVDIVAHSMGGLVTSVYYTKYGSEKIDKIITCGTPYEGAPAVMNSIFTKDVTGDVWKDSGLSYLGWLTSGIKKKFSGVMELLPTESYVDKIKMKKAVRRYPKFFHRNYEKYEYEYEYEYFDISTEEYNDICRNIFGTEAYSKVQSFQNSILNTDEINNLLDYENSYFVIGVNQKTIYSLIFDEFGEYMDKIDKKRLMDIKYETTGDGTVPYLSETMMRNIEKLPEERVRKIKVDHVGTAISDESIAWICDVLSGAVITDVSGVEVDTSSYIVVRVACPTDVEISRNGERLVFNLTDGEFIDETSFGRMDILGEDENSYIKMFCLDQYDDYDIKIRGTGQGDMEYAIRYFDDHDNLYDERSIVNIPLEKGMKISTSSDESRDTMLLIDHEGDGIIDREIKAASNSLVHADKIEENDEGNAGKVAEEGRKPEDNTSELNQSEEKEPVNNTPRGDNNAKDVAKGGSSDGNSIKSNSAAAKTTDSSVYPVVYGEWRFAEGKWSFRTAEHEYKNEWCYAYNPYADVEKGQNSADWFYFDAEGYMVTGEVTIGSANYYFNEVSDGTRGRWIRGRK